MGVTPANLWLYEGQSLANRPPASPYPSFVKLSFPGDVSKIVARGGTSWEQRTVDAPDRVDKHNLQSVAGRTILIDTAGTTDLNFFTAAQSIAQAHIYWTARRAAGWDFLVATTVPDSSTFDSTEDAQRVILNDAIEDSVDPGVMLDAFVDWRLIPDFENYLSGAFALELGEYTHFTAAAAEDLAAPSVAAVLQTLPL
jgi:hypothetical protein